MDQDFINKIKKLREETGAPIGKCKEALEKEKGDLEKAKIYLRKIGESLLKEKSSKISKNGIVEGYIHFNGRVGALVEILAETDFVSQNPEFKKLAHEIAMQVAFMKPIYVSSDDISEQDLKAKKDEFLSEIKDKPDKIKEQVVQGKLDKWFEEVCLIDQTYFKDENLKVKDLINEYANKFGEKIEISRFVRLARDE